MTIFSSQLPVALIIVALALRFSSNTHVISVTVVSVIFYLSWSPRLWGMFVVKKCNFNFTVATIISTTDMNFTEIVDFFATS